MLYYPDLDWTYLEERARTEGTLARLGELRREVEGLLSDNYEEYRQRRGEFMLKRLRAGWRHGPRQRPRDPEEELLLLRVALHRRRAWIDEGKLEILGPRRYRLNL